MPVSKPSYLCDEDVSKCESKKRSLPKRISKVDSVVTDPNGGDKIKAKVMKTELEYFNIPSTTKLIIVTTASECDDCCTRILSLVVNDDDFLVLSLDIEWKVEFKRGAKLRPVALLQLACDNLIILFHLVHCGITDLSMNVLANDKIFYIGVGISADITRLLRDIPNKEYKINNYFDLRSFHYTVRTFTSLPGREYLLTHARNYSLTRHQTIILNTVIIHCLIYSRYTTQILRYEKTNQFD